MSSRKLPRHVHTPEEVMPAYSETIARDWIPQLDWTRMAFQTWADFQTFIGVTAQNIFDIIGEVITFAEWTATQIATVFVNWSHLVATGALGLLDFGASIWTGVLNAANVALTSLADGFFTGVSGLAKFITGFFTADATGRGKFQDLFVTTALIGNLAVTTAKIDALAVTAAKIDSLAVTTAKIDDLSVTAAKIANATITGAKIANLTVDTANIADLAVTTGKIYDLAVTNVKIANGTLEIGKCTSEFAQYSYFEHNRWITSVEALTGYQVSLSGGGSVTARKNYLAVNSGTGIGSSAKIKGYPIVDPAHNPKVKSRFRVTIFPTSTDYKSRFIDAGIGDFGVAGLFFRFRYDTSGNRKIYAYSYDGTNTTIVELQTFALNTWYILEIRKGGANVLFRIDNVDKTNISTNLPTAMLEDSLHYAQADSETAGAVEFEECYMTVTEDWM